MEPERGVRLRSDFYYTYINLVTVPHKMVRLQRMLDCKGVGLQRFNCTVVYVRMKLILVFIAHCSTTK